MKIILENALPCWYELSFSEEGLVLRVHKDLIKYIQEDVKTDIRHGPLVSSLREEFRFSIFVSSFGDNFGFGNAFIRSGKQGEFVEFAANLPIVKRLSKEKCSYCDGSGKGKFLDGPCISCEGKGKKYEYYWKTAEAISATLTVFLQLAKMFEFSGKETSCSLPQLLTIETTTRKGQHGGSFCGEYSFVLTDYLSRCFSIKGGRSKIPEMNAAMQAAYKKMGLLKKYNDYDFEAHIEN